MDSLGHSPSREAVEPGYTAPERTAVEGMVAKCMFEEQKAEDSSTRSVAEESRSVRRPMPPRSNESPDAAAIRCSASMQRAAMLCKHIGSDTQPVLAASHRAATRRVVAGAFQPEALMAGACKSHCGCRCSRNQPRKPRRATSALEPEHCT